AEGNPWQGATTGLKRRAERERTAERKRPYRAEELVALQRQGVSACSPLMIDHLIGHKSQRLVGNTYAAQDFGDAA
ncbi:hypothetical protein KGY14_15970, partial [Ameyamaea chiangmaiensis]|uniref:hypothetical protein n=1 Tax=Ameyamaea chiangmaiensis TaxID=442969 RepID=UPI001BAF1078